jgi:hypothetical protein
LDGERVVFLAVGVEDGVDDAAAALGRLEGLVPGGDGRPAPSPKRTQVERSLSIEEGKDLGGDDEALPRVLASMRRYGEAVDEAGAGGGDVEGGGAAGADLLARTQAWRGIRVVLGRRGERRSG